MSSIGYTKAFNEDYDELIFKMKDGTTLDAHKDKEI